MICITTTESQRKKLDYGSGEHFKRRPFKPRRFATLATKRPSIYGQLSDGYPAAIIPHCGSGGFKVVLQGELKSVERNSKVRQFQKKKILLIAEGVSMAHPTRLYELARRIPREEFEIHFATAKDYLHFFTFESDEIQPHQINSVSTVKFNERLFRGSFPLTLGELNEAVVEDERLILEIKPDLVISDFRLSLKATLPKRSIPWFNLIQFYWSMNFVRPNLIPWIRPVEIFGRPFVEKTAFLTVPIFYKRQLFAVHDFEDRHGVDFSKDIFDFYSAGTYRLYPDMAEIFQSSREISDGQFIGPLLWKNPSIPFPGEWASNTWQRFGPQKVAYVTMGSTGAHKLNREIVEVLLDKNFNIYLSHSGDFKLEHFSDRVRQARFLPSDLILQNSDILICNGGTSSVYHGLYHSNMIFGIAGNMDQCLNMYTMRGNSLGDYLTVDQFSSDRFRASIEAQLASYDSRMSLIKKTQDLIRTYEKENYIEQVIRRFL